MNADRLTRNPEKVMAEVWAYLGEEPFQHDFNNVEQYTQEHELGWPYGDHSIRSEVKPLVQDWDTVLGRPLADAINQKFNWIKDL